MKMPERRGFTLVEVLMTVVAVSIVTAIALPGYVKSAEVQRRTQAANTLRLIRQAEQVYQSIHGVYTTNIANLTTLPPTLGTNFSYAVAVPSATQFVVTATRVNGPACSMTINDTGQLVNCVSGETVWNGGIGGGTGGVIQSPTPDLPPGGGTTGGGTTGGGTTGGGTTGDPGGGVGGGTTSSGQ